MNESGNAKKSGKDAAQAATRRKFLQGTLAVAGSMLATQVATPAAASEPAPKRPNLIFFLGEGQRADAMSIAGHPLVKTPNQDRIGHEGMRFRNAFCTNALCAPARASELTGMYSRSTGALSNKDMERPIPADIPLFTDLLREAGYDIAIVGKVHVQNGVEDRHWNYYFGHNAPSNDYVNPQFKEGRDGKVGPQKRYKGVYPDDLCTDRAIAWLEQDRGDRPFCLLVWFVAPHEPFFRARRHFDLYRGAVIPKPGTFDDDLKGYPGKPKAFVDAENKLGTTMEHVACGSLEGVAKDYYAGLVACDDNMGKVLAYLESKKILDDTAIVTSSDHGYFLGEFRLFDKRLMHEPSIRIPLMIRYPKRIPAGTVRSEMALDLDLAPTFLDLAGLPIPAHMQGKSLLPLAPEPNPEFRKEWFYEYFEWPNPEAVRPHRGIRDERYKLIHYTMEPQEFEMYDLLHDPAETRNLYGDPQHAALQKDLWQRMQAMQDALPVHPEL